MSIKTPLEVVLDRLPSGMRRMLSPSPVIFKSGAVNEAPRQELVRWSDAQREMLPGAEQLYKNKTEDFFFRHYVLPDGRRATLILQGGVERWYVEPIEEPVPIQQFLAAYLVMEHGWLTGDPVPAQTRLENYNVRLSDLFVNYYAGQGDPVCPEGYDHFYGVAEDASPCDFGLGYNWNDALPSDGDASIVETLDGGGVGVLDRFYEDPLRNPARYSGLARLTAQAMGAFRPITEQLFSFSFGPPNPLYTGIVRDYDGTRLNYWLVKVASAGVGMLKLGWPVKLGSVAAAVLTGEVNGETLTPEQRTRYETLLLSSLTTRAALDGGELEPVLVVTQAQHEALIGGEGFAFLDGQPFFSPQPWGSANERNPRCVLTDIRKRFDLGTSVNDPWEMCTTMEYHFVFDEDGNPSCNVITLDKSRWFPRSDKGGYCYRSESGRFCQHYAFSISPVCPSAQTATIAAWYSPDGNLCMIRQSPPNSSAGDLYESDPSSQICIPPTKTGWNADADYSDTKSSYERKTNYSQTIDSWSFSSAGGESGGLDIESSSFGSRFRREITGSASGPIATFTSLTTGFSPGREHSPQKSCRDYKIDGCGDDYLSDLLCAPCQNAPRGWTYVTRTVYFYGIGGAEEIEENVQNGSIQESAYVLRLGPSRDVVITAKAITQNRGTGYRKTYGPQDAADKDLGFGGVQYDLEYTNGTDIGGTITTDVRWFGIVPHEDSCISSETTDIRDGTWDWNGGSPIQSYEQWGASNRLQKMTSNVGYNGEVETQKEGSVFAPGYPATDLPQAAVDTIISEMSALTRFENCTGIGGYGYYASYNGSLIVAHLNAVASDATDGYPADKPYGRFIGAS